MDGRHRLLRAEIDNAARTLLANEDMDDRRVNMSLTIAGATNGSERRERHGPAPRGHHPDRAEGVKLEEHCVVTQSGLEVLSRFPFETSLLG